MAIAQLKQGHLAGLEVLVRRYQVRALHAALVIVRDRMVAEEVVQQAFLNAAQKIAQFDEERPFAPWFIRSVVNAALQEIGRQKRLIAWEDEMSEAAGRATEWLVDPALCPEDLVENEALYQAVWRALDQLEPRQRAVLVLRYLEDQTDVEVASHFRRPLTTIKWWGHLARRRMRHLLGQDRQVTLTELKSSHE